MATQTTTPESIIQSVTKEVGGSITKRRCVKLSSDKIVVCDALGEGVYSVAGQEDLTASSVAQSCPRLGSIVHVEVGAAVSAGDFVTVDANGQVITADRGTHDFAVGWAENDGAAINDTIAISFSPHAIN